jgi:hypothetical protein
MDVNELRMRSDEGTSTQNMHNSSTRSHTPEGENCNVKGPFIVLTRRLLRRSHWPENDDRRAMVQYTRIQIDNPEPQTQSVKC